MHSPTVTADVQPAADEGIWRQAGRTQSLALFVVLRSLVTQTVRKMRGMA